MFLNVFKWIDLKTTKRRIIPVIVCVFSTFVDTCLVTLSCIFGLDLIFLEDDIWVGNCGW